MTDVTNVDHSLGYHVSKVLSSPRKDPPSIITITSSVQTLSTQEDMVSDTDAPCNSISHRLFWFPVAAFEAQGRCPDTAYQ